MAILKNSGDRIGETVRIGGAIQISETRRGSLLWKRPTTMGPDFGRRRSERTWMFFMTYPWPLPFFPSIENRRDSLHDCDDIILQNAHNFIR